MSKGFTLIEALVAISVIFITLLIVSLNYPNIRKELALQRAVHKISQDLRRTQEAAMSAKCLSCQIIFNIAQPTSYQVLGETVNLEKFVEIGNLSPGPILTIVFSPPSPTTLITNGIISVSEAEITVGNGIRQKKVKINNAGRIEIE